MSTAIEWTKETWNPTTGVVTHADELDKPRSWKKPRTVFVNSTSDLFHDDVPDSFIARVWQTMATTSRHTYQVLTKRPERMRDWVNRCAVSPAGWITHDGTDPGGAYDGTGVIVGYPEPTYQIQQWGPRGGKRRPATPPVYGWPLSNVWLGTSIESDRYAYRADALRGTPAAVRFISAEPLLGPLPSLDLTGIDWLIAGGESGPGARPMHPNWVRDLRDRCQEAGVAFFFKQWGEHLPVAVEDDPQYAGGRAFNHPRGGRMAAYIRERGPSRTFRSGVTRPMRPGDENGHGRMLDADTIAVRVGKKAAGRELDGRTWDEYPTREAVPA